MSWKSFQDWAWGALDGAIGVAVRWVMISVTDARQFLQKKVDARRSRNRVAWEKAAGECRMLVADLISSYYTCAETLFLRISFRK